MIRTMRDPGRLLRTVAIAVIAGIGSSFVVALFDFCLEYMLGFFGSLGTGASIALPFAGAVLAGLFILRKVPSAGGEGVQYYIDAVNFEEGRFDLKATVLRFPATLISLAMFGSGGVVGPLTRICAGTGSWSVGNSVGRTPLRMSDDHSIGAICGVSGAISAIFHSPLAAGLYATEILKRESIRYSDLIVALLSAVVSYVTSSIILGEERFFMVDAPKLGMSAPQLIWFPVTALAGGLIGILFIFSYERSAALFQRIPGRQPSQAVAAAVMLSASAWLGLGWIMRISPELYRELAAGNISLATSLPLVSVSVILPLIMLILLKILLTVVTIGSGMSAGFTGPLIIIGMALGALVSVAAGAEPASASYYGYMACGMAALLAATLNIPLAAIALTMTVFGTSYILPAVTGSSIAFILFKGYAVYQYRDSPPSRGSNGNGL